MPFPRQVTAEGILVRAREQLEQSGPDGASLASIAAALRVRPPSLYRYYPRRTALIRAINTLTVREHIEAMERAAGQVDDAETRLLYAARAFRDYAHAWPASVLLAYGSSDPALQAAAAEAEQRVLPLQAIVAEVAGAQDSLTGLRGLFAICFGFVALELNGVFRRGGDLAQAYEDAVRMYISGLRRRGG